MTTDYPAVQRAIETRSEVILAAKRGVNGVYTADPNIDPTARRFRSVPYNEVLDRGLNVMDQSAFILARDHELPIHVFDANEPGALYNACRGDDIGTYIGPDIALELV